MTHVNLLAWARSLDADTLRRVSRIRIEPAPGRARVSASVASFRAQPPLAVDEHGQTIGPVLRRPVSADNAKVLRQVQPPVTQLARLRAPDIETEIAVEDLDGQIREVDASGLLGGLNVEHVGRATVISTHASTQGERDAWLRSIR